MIYIYFVLVSVESYLPQLNTTNPTSNNITFTQHGITQHTWIPHPHDEENGAEYNVGYKGPNQTSINIHDIHLTLMVNNIYLSFDDIYKHLPFVERHLINVDDTIFIILPIC